MFLLQYNWKKKNPITISFVFCLHPAPIIECLPVNQALFQALGIQLGAKQSSPCSHRADIPVGETNSEPINR